jgi:hypothetical protein
MTLDDEQVPWREALRRDRERDWADRKAAHDEQKLTESVEAMEAHWRGVFREGARHWSSSQHWDGT